MKRFHALLLVLPILLVFALPASADILWEPFSNDYYMKVINKGERLDYAGRTYVVPEGMTANLYKTPEGKEVLKTMEAGTRIYIGPCGELFDDFWGVGYAHGDFETEGWVRLNRLQLEYDHVAFAEAFGNQFVATDDKLTKDDIDGDIQTWTYPGSGISSRIIPADALDGSYNDGVMTFQYVWTDPDGGRWGYVGYYMGRCGWVWLDDPTNPEPPVRTYPAGSTVTDTSPEEVSRGISPVLVAVPVAVLVLVTAIAIVLLKKKSRKS